MFRGGMFVGNVRELLWVLILSNVHRYPVIRCFYTQYFVNASLFFLAPSYAALSWGRGSLSRIQMVEAAFIAKKERKKG